MISATITFAVHTLLSSFRVLKPVCVVLEYVWPLYSNMANKAVKGSINFNTKHLKKGDPLPPFTGKLRVYNMRFCPYAQRTILVLNAKNIDYEVVNIHLKDKPEWLTTKSPLGKVPAIEISNNITIFESLVTVEYLDDVYPQRQLLPKDPVKKAYDKIIVEVFSSVTSLFHAIILNTGSVTNDQIAAYHKALKFIQDQLRSRGTTFLDGDEPGYVDYMIWPWFERILLMDDERTHIKHDEYKLLTEYLNKMWQDPAVAQYVVPKEALVAVFEAYKNKVTPNYDILLEN